MAAHVALDHPVGVAWLLDYLREAGAQDQVAALARDLAPRVSLDHSPGVGILLASLQEAGAQDQVTALVGRLPAAGMFELFRQQQDHQDRFRFGRETDGRPAEQWDWDDLDLWLVPDRGDREATLPVSPPPTRRIRKVSLDSSLPGRPELHCKAQLSALAPRSLQSDRTTAICRCCKMHQHRQRYASLNIAGYKLHQAAHAKMRRPPLRSATAQAGRDGGDGGHRDGPGVGTRADPWLRPSPLRCAHEDRGWHLARMIQPRPTMTHASGRSPAHPSARQLPPRLPLTSPRRVSARRGISGTSRSCRGPGVARGAECGMGRIPHSSAPNVTARRPRGPCSPGRNAPTFRPRRYSAGTVGCLVSRGRLRRRMKDRRWTIYGHRLSRAMPCARPDGLSSPK